MPLLRVLDCYYAQYPERFYFGVFALSLMVYVQRMGLLPLFADEPTRSVVALEMILSKNYWVPTINGEFYYRKPPLYNWIIIGVYKLFGSYSEGVFRLPSILPLALFGPFIYIFFKNKLGHAQAFIGAFSFVLCGRFLVYAGYLGHIDILYSFLTFAAFCIQIRAYQKQNWKVFFILCYALHGVAFLMKGLPSILFAGITPVAILLYHKQYKRLFDYRHFIGMILFALPVVAYFYQYAQFNGLYGWVDQLTDQSTQRTVMNNSFWQSISHLFLFPVEQFMHLAPVFFLFPLILVKRFRAGIMANKYWVLILVVLVANLPPYWLSPGYYPRYLFMLYPFVCLICGYLWLKAKDSRYIKIFEIGMAVLSLLAGIMVWVAPYLMPTVIIPAVWIKCLVVSALFVFFGWLMYRMPKMRYVFLALILINFRLFFNWFILEDRMQNGPTPVWKADALRIGQRFADTQFYKYSYTYITHESVFYIETETQKILARKDDFEKDAFYVIHDDILNTLHNQVQLEVVDTMRVRAGEGLLKVVRLQD